MVCRLPGGEAEDLVAVRKMVLVKQAIVATLYNIGSGVALRGLLLLGRYLAHMATALRDMEPGGLFCVHKIWFRAAVDRVPGL